VLHDAAIETVEDLADVSHVSVRTLQRLFRVHMGLSPKTVLNRFRLMAAVHAADSRAVRSWADAASGLGYADQAHLARDFRNRLDVTPGSYARAAAERR
jgi:transcriptional regulator GlxA family with amidase domain